MAPSRRGGIVSRNPPCYRCESSVPLPAGRIGLCARCEAEVVEKRDARSAVEVCKCGHWLTTDWERIQHQVHQRHAYRAWGDEDRRRAAQASERERVQ